MRAFWLWLAALAGLPSLWGDGKIFPQVALPAVTIPDQRAVIAFGQGRETLAIETSFVGQGTNFAWVVPTPSVPQVALGPAGLFDVLQDATRPRLMDRSPRYWFALVLGAVGVYLVWRNVSETDSSLPDLPWCLAAGTVAGLALQSWIWGGVVLFFNVLLRVVPSGKNVAWVGLVYATLVGFASWWSGAGSGLVRTLGSDDELEARSAAVTVISRQQVGVYDTAVLQARDGDAFMRWLAQHGFAAPSSILPAVEAYLREGWTLAAARVRRNLDDGEAAQPAPLALTFDTPQPVYPLRLTGVGNVPCRIELYVLGDRRASARHFKTEGCLRVESAHEDTAERHGTDPPGVSLAGYERWTRAAPVLSKLVGLLSPEDMVQDATIRWRRPTFKRPTLYSARAAWTLAANVAVLIAAAGCLGPPLARGSWEPSARRLARLRVVCLLSAVAVGLAVYRCLPKTAVVYAPAPGWSGARGERHDPGAVSFAPRRRSADGHVRTDERWLPGAGLTTHAAIGAPQERGWSSPPAGSSPRGSAWAVGARPHNPRLGSPSGRWLSSEGLALMAGGRNPHGTGRISRDGP